MVSFSIGYDINKDKQMFGGKNTLTNVWWQKYTDKCYKNE